MVYVAAPDNELLYSAQVEVHGKRGGPQVVFPSPEDGEVKELFEKKKTERDENRKEAEKSGELVTGLHVPSEKENPETVTIAGRKEVNKNLSTPGAAPLISDNVGIVTHETGVGKEKVNPVTGQPEEKKVDPISGEDLLTPPTGLSEREKEEATFGSTVKSNKVSQDESPEEIRARIRKNLEANK